MADTPDTPAVQESFESGIVQGRQYRYTIDGLGVQLDRYVGGVCSTLMVRSSTIGLVGALRIAKLCLAHHGDGATLENVIDLRDELINLVSGTCVGPNGSPLPTAGTPRSPPQSPDRCSPVPDSSDVMLGDTQSWPEIYADTQSRTPTPTDSHGSVPQILSPPKSQIPTSSDDDGVEGPEAHGFGEPCVWHNCMLCFKDAYVACYNCDIFLCTEHQNRFKQATYCSCP